MELHDLADANQIDTMEAGHEMNALVAERVMGWQHFTRKNNDLATLGRMGGYIYANQPFIVSNMTRSGSWDEEEWCPSRDISAAWQVVEKLFSLGWELQLEMYGDGPTINCVFGIIDNEGWSMHCEGTADTAPLAICRAAIRAVGKE